MKNPVLPSSCVTPAGTSIEVQNEWEENTHTHCSADHEQDWQPYSVDPYSAMIYVMTIHAYIHTSKICTSRESVSPLSRLIRGFRNKYH